MAKQRLLLFGGIFLLIIMSTFAFLGMTRSVDTFNLYAVGFTQYANHWFLTNGRWMAAILYYIAGFLRMDIDVFIMLGKIISLFLATTCIHILYEEIQKRKPACHKITAILLSCIIIMNPGSYAFFYYAESIVMWLSVLFILLALRNALQNKPLLTGIYILLSLFSYQTSFVLFIPLYICLLGYEENYNFKNMVKRGIPYAVILIVLVVVNLAFASWGRSLSFSAYQNQKSLQINFLNLQSFGSRMKKLFWNSGLTVSNRVITSAIILVLFAPLFLLGKEKSKKPFAIIFWNICMTILIFVLSTAMIANLNYYYSERIIYGYYSLFGILLLSVFLHAEKNVWIMLISAIVFLMNAYVSYTVGTEHRTARAKEKTYAHQILQCIEDYEKETGMTVTNVFWCKDQSYREQDIGLKSLGTYPYRSIGNYWCEQTALQYYLGERFVLEKNNEIQKQYFENKNWDRFDAEQCVFQDHTLFLCIY